MGIKKEQMLAPTKDVMILAIEIALNDHFYAVLCFFYAVHCNDSLDIPEYLLITKISQWVEICMKCPICQCSITASGNSNIKSVIQARIKQIKSSIIDKSHPKL